MPTSFTAFADLCQTLEATTKRNEKKHLIAQYLRTLDKEEIPPTIRFLTAKPFPETDERVLEISGRTLWKLQDTGQSKLTTDPLTIPEIATTFDNIAKATGHGSRSKKETLLKGLLRRASPLELKYLFRLLSREMRIGAVEGVVMEAIAEASEKDLKLIQRANMLSGNLGEVAKTALTQGLEGLTKTGLKILNPIKPMLAEMSYDLVEVLEEHGGRTALEWKFDGARIQVHIRGDEMRVFSRRLTDVTESLPDIIAITKTHVHANEALVEGEAVATGEGEKPLPFQDLMRRFRRVHDIPKTAREIPLRLYLFDILYLNQELLVDQPYKTRWQILKQTVDDKILAPRIVTDNLEEAKRFLEAALKAGHEGLMAKALDSPYTPGVRGKKWFKVKPFETLDLAIIAAEWGYGRREGWLSNYHLAALDVERGEYLSLGKTFKGLTDEEFICMTKRLQSIKTREDQYTVYVKPGTVVEVAYNEIQRSPHYKSGFALRFARILRIRDDKGPADVDTIERVRGLYNRQFMTKARLRSDFT